ncbi:transporter [Acinetobacter sp. ANC 4558]|uniref:TolC family protein n=1 Tax=Acinetobacter sp. ANC 4558 TaxID=1977876 RepID=UPI000B664E70|nr:TolC family protein [Acinetobacter sp. ANC 4558]OTG87629.1 transporter [Acinetobacter sp. ANC 4558]
MGYESVHLLSTLGLKMMSNSFKTTLKIGFISLLYSHYSVLHAETLSYYQAEQKIISESFTTQASQALEQASQLQAEAIKGLGLPVINFNVRAISYHAKVDVPLGSVKNNLDHSLVDKVNGQIDQWQSNNGGILSPQDADILKQGAAQGIKDGIGLIPNSYDLTLKDESIRPSVSFVMPLYTGGLTTSAKELAKLQAQKSKISSKQQQDLQKLEIIQAYFSAQLQKQLYASSQFNSQAMQKHYNNALKLEKQGFISKGQRMQFEVARNDALRILQTTETVYKTSLFRLNNLLQSNQIHELTTPLFINSSQNQDLNTLLTTFEGNSNLIRQLQTDTQLANVNIKAQYAAKKPTVFAFGEYSLENKENWIVGVGATYNLFSGIDKNKNIQAAELQKRASELLTARTKQEIETIIYASFNEVSSSLKSHQLLEGNIKAAQENLRIQELSFKEDMASATQVIDAQNALTIIHSEMALNAYKYIISLATLLQNSGSIDQFQTYINQPNTHYIK